MIEEAIGSVTYTPNVAMVTVNNIPNDIGYIAQILTVIAQRSVVVDMISQTAPYEERLNLSFTIAQDDLNSIVDCTAAFKALSPKISTNINGNNTKIILSGAAMRNRFGIAAGVMTALAEAGIAVKLITTAEEEISILIDIKDAEAAKKLFS